MTTFYLTYLALGLLYTVITFPSYREERGSSFNRVGAAVYVVWSILFWLPMLAYMIFNKSRR